MAKATGIGSQGRSQRRTVWFAIFLCAQFCGDEYADDSKGEIDDKVLVVAGLASDPSANRMNTTTAVAERNVPSRSLFDTVDLAPRRWTRRLGMEGGGMM